MDMRPLMLTVRPDLFVYLSRSLGGSLLEMCQDGNRAEDILPRIGFVRMSMRDFPREQYKYNIL